MARDDRASGGRYITWEGLSKAKNNGSPADVISVDFDIAKPGSYRFTWAMRQPDDVESDKANDSWLNFPDANRFGPVGGGSYSGFIKVFGNSKGGFDYKATADVKHEKSTIAIDFDRPGTYTMQIAGRSHGHQIDRIVIRQASINQADAVAGRNTGCGGRDSGNSAPAPARRPEPPSTTESEDAGTESGDAGVTAAPGNDGGASGTLGRFDRGRDVLLCNYDSKPDEDDLHSVAGLGTILKDSRIRGINYHCTAGAYGKQTGTFLSEPRLFDLAFGSNWASADQNRDRAVNIAADKAVAALDDGGDVWVTEAGQSDVTAGIVKRIQSLRPGVDTNRRVHVVQHSEWNEDQTTPSDLRFVKNNTQYNKIADGNSSGNGSPKLKTSGDQYWSRAKNDTEAGAIWREADAAAMRGMGIDWDNDTIKGGGMDFSDTVEPLFVFGFDQSINNEGDFFDEFL